MRGALFLVLLVVSGCMSDSQPPDAAGTLRVLAIGDSYTIGEGVAPADRWPARLAAALRSDSLPVADPEIVAVTGWTVAELNDGIDSADPQGPFHLVTLLIGVNDAYRGGDVETYRPAFRTMLARAVGFAGGDARRVVVLSIPDWTVTPFAASTDRDLPADATRLEAFNAAARAETAAAGSRWVDVWDVSRAHGAAEVAPDGLHPSGAMYARWAALALSEARTALSA